MFGKLLDIQYDCNKNNNINTTINATNSIITNFPQISDKGITKVATTAASAVAGSQLVKYIPNIAGKAVAIAGSLVLPEIMDSVDNFIKK